MAVPVIAGAIGTLVSNSDDLNKRRQQILCEEGEITVEIENQTNDDFEMYIGCDGSTVGSYMGNWQITNVVRQGKSSWTFTSFNGYFGFTKTHQICILFNKKTKQVSKFSVYGGPAPKYKTVTVRILDNIITLNDHNHAVFKDLQKDDKIDCYYYKMKLEGVD